MSPHQPDAPRTLADQLRSWPDEALAELLRERPDLASPAPQDCAQLASRAVTRASVQRALDRLTHLELTVLEAALAEGPGASADRLRTLVNAAPAAVDAAVERLRGLVLLWGTERALRPVGVLADLPGVAVSGLGPGAATLLSSYGPGRVAALADALGLRPTGDRAGDVEAVAARLADPTFVQRLVAEVDDRARAVLDHLEREGREGAVETAEHQVARTDTTAGPVDQLLARGLLLARDRRHVAVPREVGVALRGGRTTREPADTVPEPATSPRDPALVDRAAAGAAFELVRHVELLLEHWGTHPPAALRAGGLGVRDLRAAAELLHTDERAAALHVELAAAADLLVVGDTDEQDAAWLPTEAFDVWASGSVADRWVRLAQAWLDSPRLIGLVGTRRDGKPVNALAPDLERGWLPGLRRTVLAELAALPAGQVLAAGTGVPSLVARLDRLRPRRPAGRAEAVAWAVEEAAVLGVTGLGGLAAHGRALVEADDPAHAAPALLQPLLPEPVDHVLLQADLTAVAPGPLTHQLAHDLATLADIESRGGATVYRFTERSVRRAFDSGWSAREVHDFLATASRTAVPQPLTYLVDDVSRKFGTVRVGAAGSFLRSDDEAALTDLVHHPRAVPLRLRRIAPTVVVSDVPVDVLLPRLRELGAAPVVEAPDGTVRLARREVYRARTPRGRPAAVDPAGATPYHPTDPRTVTRLAARVAATVAAVRAGDRAAASAPAEPAERASPAAVLAVLREAADAGRSVRVEYVDGHGATVTRVLDPKTVQAGRLTAYDHRSEEVREFAVHRISAVTPL